MANETKPAKPVLNENQKFVESMLESSKQKSEHMVTDKRRELNDDEVQNVNKILDNLKRGGTIRK